MIEVTELTKRYGRRTAVDGLSFVVGKGEIVGFLGPNGAGKSTTMRILAGYLAPSKGKVQVAGIDVELDPRLAKEKIGYMPEAVPLYPEMRVVEYLGFRAEAKGIARARRRSRIAECMEKTRIADVANVVCGSLSKGYKQRVGLADALLAAPPVLLLDEPTAGLDPNQVREVRSLLIELANEHTVLLSTHILSEVDATCSRAIIVHKGRLHAEGTLAEIRAAHAPTFVELTVRGADAALKKVATALSAKSVGKGDTRVLTVPLPEASLRPGKPNEEAMDRLAEHAARSAVEGGLELRELRRGAFGLEEVFAELTRSEQEQEAS